jgi:hypothetical protein
MQNAVQKARHPWLFFRLENSNSYKKKMDETLKLHSSKTAN